MPDTLDHFPPMSQSSRSIAWWAWVVVAPANSVANLPRHGMSQYSGPRYQEVCATPTRGRPHRPEARSSRTWREPPA
jgi:hypothetical protein